jgi:hypothetical protein
MYYMDRLNILKSLVNECQGEHILRYIIKQENTVVIGTHGMTQAKESWKYQNFQTCRCVCIR